MLSTKINTQLQKQIKEEFKKAEKEKKENERKLEKEKKENEKKLEKEKKENNKKLEKKKKENGKKLEKEKKENNKKLENERKLEKERKENEKKLEKEKKANEKKMEKEKKENEKKMEKEKKLEKKLEKEKKENNKKLENERKLEKENKDNKNNHVDDIISLISNELIFNIPVFRKDIIKTKLSNKKDKKMENNKYVVKKISDLCSNAELINLNFNKCIKGYHLVNNHCINETMWEDINAVIFESLGINIYSKSDGNHMSGMDISCSLGRISNKSAKYSNNKKSIDISSYRLTTVCSEKKCGTPIEIISEINKRKNFDYYSFIVRDENTISQIVSYDWLLIPSNHLILEPSSYIWEPTIGKRGKNKDAQVGWNTNTINGCKMTITFSMSSQLWIHIEMNEEIKQFIIASSVVENKPRYNYIDLHDNLTNI